MPTPPFLDHCVDGPQYGWPRFENKTQLEADFGWAFYFRSVYGSIPQTGYPICTFSLAHLYGPVLTKAGISLPALRDDCPESTGDFYATMTDRQANWSHWIWNPNLRQPLDAGTGVALPPLTWVEVLQQSSQVDGEAMWMYYAPGTSIWFNLGTTYFYQDHDDAVQQLLGRSCAGGTDDHDCTEDFAELYASARDFNIDSLQFLNHVGMPCGDGSKLRNMAVEIVDLALGSGSTACGQPDSGVGRFRAGWEAGSLCDCDSSQEVLNCAGFGIRGLWRLARLIS